MQLHTVKYRPDIDGLRGIAVILVVGFHAFPEWVRGGFIGVDIFFVISGYLITSIIVQDARAGRFNLFDFYAKRARRIFPALILVLFSVFGLGWYVLFADEFAELGKHILGGALFISNFISWSESGYFDRASELKPLLHLWSLAIEEQFYLIWPLVIWLSFKSKYRLVTITSALILLSFGLGKYELKADPIAVFYAPWMRGWELLCGAWLALIEDWRKHSFSGALKDGGSPLYRLFHHLDGTFSINVRALLGICCILLGVLRISKESNFPGTWALLPTLGTVLIISSLNRAWLSRVVLSNPVLTWIGLISYPLYLWHWPLLSFARVASAETPSIFVRFVLVIIAVLLSWLTFRFVEQPIRRSKNSLRTWLIALPLLMVLGLVGLYAYLMDGLPRRHVQQVNALQSSGKDGSVVGIPIGVCPVHSADGQRLQATCIVDLRESPRFGLIGDSKALAIHEGLIRTSSAGGRWLMVSSGKEGIFVPVISEEKLDPRAFLPYTLAAIEAIKGQGIKQVAIVTSARTLFGYDSHKSLDKFPLNKNYEIAYQGLKNTLSALVSGGIAVVLVIDNPTLFDSKDCLNRQTSLRWVNDFLPNQNPAGCTVALSSHIRYTEQYRKLLNSLVAEFGPRVSLFDTTPYMCDESEDICRQTRNGRLMYSYSDHISDYASGLIGRDLNAYMLGQ
jgi:peptidoglycan/LPS O-acetylase OafA/YrhL